MKLSEFFKAFEDQDLTKRYLAAFARYHGEFGVTFDTIQEAALFLKTGSDHGEIAYREIVDTEDGITVWKHTPFKYDQKVEDRLQELAGVEGWGDDD